MSSSLYLQGGRVNIGLLQETYQKELLCLLEKIGAQNQKAIIWDESLAGPVGLVAQYSLLREHQVIKMFPLRAGPLPSVPVKNVIFITRPDLAMMDLIAGNIHGEERNTNIGNSRKNYFLYFLPRRSLLCEESLKNRGVYGNFTLIDEFKCHFFPFDNDLISMELNSAFRELYLEGDPTCLFQSAQALMSLQVLFGPFNQVYGKGQWSKKVSDLLHHMSNQEILPSAQPLIDQVVIIERGTDLISPLATQLTYEGLIDEIFGINNCTAQFPADTFLNPDDNCQDLSPTETKQIILNSDDELYRILRDLNFNAVGKKLTEQARQIGKELEKRHGDKSVKEMKQFVAELPSILAKKKSLGIHTTIAELIKEATDISAFQDMLQCEQDFLSCIDTEKPYAHLEDMIAQAVPITKVLRLLCMQSVVGSGLKQKVFDYYKRELVQVYGINTLLTLNNLEKTGFLRVQSGGRQYAVLRKTLNLTDTSDDSSEIEPKDINYVHSIYAPISVRLAEHLARNKSWIGLQDILGVLPGPLFEKTNNSFHRHTRRGSLSSETSQNDTPKVILVFFLGGCTFAEISALRFLSRRDDINVEFVIATTKIINGNSLLESLKEPLPE